jgi:hypothetical protein
MSKVSYIFIGISAAISIYLFVSSWETENREMKYALDANSFLMTFASNRDYPMACHDEYVELAPAELDDTELLQKSDFIKIVDKAFMVCATEFHVRILPNLLKNIVEVAYIPSRTTIPYELTKRVLLPKEVDKIDRCSDLIEPMIKSCPLLLKPYIKNTMPEKSS